jgi:hypothetical protein
MSDRLCPALLRQLPAVAHASHGSGLAHAVMLYLLLLLLLLLLLNHLQLWIPLLLQSHKRARTAALRWHSTLHIQPQSCCQ